ncbi:MAG: hypothetical protein LUH82_07195 [Clostridiales bacterium]|nr:hypothetical protein [Clostridiales bacterium]
MQQKEKALDYFAVPVNYYKLAPAAKRYYRQTDSRVVEFTDGSFAEVFLDNHIEYFDNFDVLNERWCANATIS